ncbi:MAG TPA: hypothetical protein VF826_20615 [Chloroflexia bacterium]
MGSSRLPRRLLPHRVVAPLPLAPVEPLDQADPVEIALKGIDPPVIGPVATAAVAEVDSAAALGPVATAAVEVEAAEVDSAAGRAQVVPPDVLAGVATATCLAARCAPSAWTA